MSLEKLAFKDELSIEALAYRFLVKKFGTDVRIRYSEGRMVLGRQFHFTKAQVRDLLKKMSNHDPPLIAWGNRGFRILPLNCKEATA